MPPWFDQEVKSVVKERGPLCLFSTIIVTLLSKSKLKFQFVDMIVYYVCWITVPLPLIVHRSDTDGKLLLSLLESSLLKAVFFNAVRGIQGFIEVIFFP